MMLSSTLHLPFSVSPKCSLFSVGNIPFSVSPKYSLFSVGNRDSHLNPKKKSLVSHVPFCNLNFERMEPSPDFMVREALLDEEYWMAAALQWENKKSGYSGFTLLSGNRIDTIEDEYDRIKKLLRKPLPGYSHTWIIAVNEEDVTRTVPRSIVGTLELFIRCLDIPGIITGRPGIRLKETRLNTGYIGYIENVCVVKSYRRKGIASNMLHFVMKYMKSKGVNRLYGYVEKRDDGPGLALFQKVGFELLELEDPATDERMCSHHVLSLPM